MHHFEYRNHELYGEDVPLARIAQAVGTPCYIYSDATLRRHYDVFASALKAMPHQICFSVKANTNMGVLALLGSLGAGADIVSGGELFRVLRAGIAPKRIVFSGVGKQADEIEQALRAGILMFNVESEAELSLISQVASKVNIRAPIALRVNPDVDPGTHPYISTGLRKSKFGIPVRQALQVYQQAAKLPSIDVVGIDCHIGSQLTNVSPLMDSITGVVEMVKQLQRDGMPLRYVDVGGGLGIQYNEENPPTPAEYGKALAGIMAPLQALGVTLICEPGRVIVGNAGILLTRVIYPKKNDAKQFVIIDAAMNDLLRPSLYGSHHAIWPVKKPDEAAQTSVVDVVGPVCESGDFLAQDRPMPPVNAGDYLAVMSAGAYGYVMSSNYNSRPRAAEVMVRQDKFEVVRSRETLEDLIRGEQLPSWL